MIKQTGGSNCKIKFYKIRFKSCGAVHEIAKIKFKNERWLRCRTVMFNNPFRVKKFGRVKTNSSKLSTFARFKFHPNCQYQKQLRVNFVYLVN